MGEIVYDLLTSLRDHLQDKMIDNVPPEYVPTLTYTGIDGVERVLRPSLVKIGRLQDDPTDLSDDVAVPSTLIAIHTNDPGDLSDGWKHAIAGPIDESTTNLGVHVHRPYEMGGWNTWWRRFKVDVEMYLIDSDQNQEEATRLANLMRVLLEKYCESPTPVNPHGWNCVMTDDFGEYAMLSCVAKAHIWEGGGPDDDYIWRGGVWLQVLTQRE